MPYIPYPATSPYAATPQSNFFIGAYVDRPIPAAPSDRLIQIASTYHNRPDKLANDLYGVPGYWWVFMARNIDLIRDPVFDLVAGMQIMVPTIETLNAALGGAA